MFSEKIPMESSTDNGKDNEDQMLIPTRSSRFRSARDVWASMIAGLGAISMGQVLGYSSPALLNKDLQQILGDKINWFASLIAIGAVIGGPIGGMFVGKMGRKTTLLMSNLPLGLGWLLIIYGNGIGFVLCGRILTGVAIGMISLAAPLYIAEVTHQKRRGMIGAGFQLFVTLGILIVYALGMVLNWNWLAVACMGTLVLNVFLLLLVPESPRWLISQKHPEKALKSLYWLYDIKSEADEVFKALEVSQSAQSTETFTIRELVSPGVYKPILISLGLMFFQQFSGISTIIFYSSTTFQNAGFNSNPATPTLIVGAILVVTTAVSCVLMDHAGRRILLLISGVLMTLSMTSFGVYYYFTEVQGRTDLSWLSLTSVIIFVIGFSIGWGPTPWLVTSEIIPVRIRSVANGLATATNWICVFLTTEEYENLKTAMHSYGAIWFFAGFCFLGIFFVLFFLPETKGKSLEEIQNQFQPADISFS